MLAANLLLGIKSIRAENATRYLEYTKMKRLMCIAFFLSIQRAVEIARRVDIEEDIELMWIELVERYERIKLLRRLPK